MAANLARFVKASMKGWDYAVKSQAEAVKIVLKNDASGAQKETHQTRMMGAFAKLVGSGKTRMLDMKAYDSTVRTLMSGKSDPVITKTPAGAATDKIFAASLKCGDQAPGRLNTCQTLAERRHGRRPLQPVV